MNTNLFDHWARYRLLIGWGFEQRDLDLYGFDRDTSADVLRDYLGYSTYLSTIRSAVNDRKHRALAENKWLFYRWAGAMGLPIPPTIGYFESLHGITWDGRPLTRLAEVLDEISRIQPSTLVVKPVGGQAGQGVVIFDSIDHSAVVGTTRSGKIVDLREALSQLDHRPSRGFSGYVLQEVVCQHADMMALNPNQANILRVITMLTLSGQVQVNLAFAKFGRTNSMVPNWGTGALGAEIDPVTGILNAGVLKEDRNTPLSRHPDTGIEIRGKRVPLWGEVVSTCTRAARAFPGLHSIGWDILISSSGPVIIEANADWGMHSAQGIGGGFLKKPGVRDELSARGVKLPDGRISWDALRRAWHRKVRRSQ
jgi:hypothetical protein